MARLNIEELVGGLLEAAMVSQGISERQHINALKNYFNEDGTPKTQTFNIGGKDLVVPLYILADHSSIGLDELDIEFTCRLIFGKKPLNRGVLLLVEVMGVEPMSCSLYHKWTTRLVQHWFSMFRNIRFDICGKPIYKQPGLRIILNEL